MSMNRDRVANRIFVALCIALDGHPELIDWYRNGLSLIFDMEDAETRQEN